MQLIYTLIIVISLTGCVAGAPTLTKEQSERIPDIEVYKTEMKPTKYYTILGDVSAADCSAVSGTMLGGSEGKSIQILIKKAIVLNADAVVDVSCGSIPYVNNCWLAKKCDGKAVKWNKT